MIKRISFIIFSLLISDLSSACSCSDISIEKVFEKSTNVVIIKLTSITKKVEMVDCWNLVTEESYKCDEEYLIAEVQLVEPLKGGNPGTIQVYGMTEKYDCHETMELGDELILFLNSKLNVSFNSCTANRPLEFIDKKLLETWISKEI